MGPPNKETRGDWVGRAIREPLHKARVTLTCSLGFLCGESQPEELGRTV